MDNRQKIHVISSVSNLEIVLKFIRSEAVFHIVDAEAIQKLLISAEEIFVNICRYAYGKGQGDVIIEIQAAPLFSVVFTDFGIPFNPLSANKPNLAQPISERQAGGLGILIVKQYMREVAYLRVNGQNILALICK